MAKKKDTTEIHTDARLTPDFYVFTRDLKVKHDAPDSRPMVLATASSDTIDLEGDRFTREALKMMQKGFVGKLIFLNHRYSIPNDVFGQVSKAKLVSRESRVDLDLEIAVDQVNPVATMTYNMIKAGTRLGVSVGVIVQNVEKTDEDTDMSRDGKVLNITSVIPLEASIVGIPANQTSWTQQAIKSLFARGALDLDDQEVEDRPWITAAEPEVDMTKTQDTIPAVVKTDEEEQLAAEDAAAEEAAETPAEEAAEAEEPGDTDESRVDPAEVAEEVEEATVPVGEPAPGSGEGEGDHGDGGEAAADAAGGTEHDDDDAANNVGGPEKAAPGMAHPDNCPGCPDCADAVPEKSFEGIDPELDEHFSSVKAEWDTAYMNNLPDSAFAVVSAGGKKDEGGRTVPRSLRHLPHHGTGGAVDLPHLRNALSREPQTDISPADHAKAKAHLARHASAEGIGDGKMLDEIVEAFDALTKALLKQIEDNKALKEENERHAAAFAQVDKVLEIIGDMSLGAVTTSKEAFAESLAELFPMLHPDIRERMARSTKS